MACMGGCGGKTIASKKPQLLAQRPIQRPTGTKGLVSSGGKLIFGKPRIK